MSINITTQRLKEITEKIKSSSPDKMVDVLSDAYLELMKSVPIGEKLLAGKGEKIAAFSQITNSKLNVLYPETAADVKAQVYKDMDTAQKIWGRVPVVQRARMIGILKDKLKENAEFFKLALMIEIGKPAKTSAAEVDKSLEYLEFFTSKHFTGILSGEVIDKGNDKVITERRPRGKVGVIASANYPMALSMPGIISGLVSGNSVITKPTTKAMLWSVAFKQLVNDSFHEWAANTKYKSKRIKLTDKDAVEDLANSLFVVAYGYKLEFYKDVNALFFVGGEEKGKEIRKERFNHKIETGIENGTEIIELGGIAPVIVTASASTDEIVAKAIAKDIWAGATGASGQRCTATKILFLTEKAHPGLVDLIKSEAEKIDANRAVIDSPFSDAAEYGPIFDAKVVEQMSEVRELAKKCGLSPIGGNALGKDERPAGGRYVTPMVVDIGRLANKKQEFLSDDEKKLLSIMYTKEIFGPLLFIAQGVKSVSHAIKLCNRIDQPLSAGFYGSDKEFLIFRKGTEFGSINHNKTAKDLSPLGNHGARQRSGGSVGGHRSIVEAVTTAISSQSSSFDVAEELSHGGKVIVYKDML